MTVEEIRHLRYYHSMERTPELIDDGNVALRAADWSQARACFEAALAHGDCPEAHDGMGLALWWLNSIEAAHEQRTLAFAAFKQRGDLARAAGIAAWLAREQVFLRANGSAMNGWFARAERLLDEAGPCRERGWFIIYRASMLDGPAELAMDAEEVLAIARGFADADLEAIARAFGGLARVSLGQVDAGLTQLDEAMAAATSGEAVDYATTSEVFCVMLSACELVGDLERTRHWCEAATEFARRNKCRFLAAYCRTTYGGLLAATGRWHDAESELGEAIRTFDAGHRALKVHATIKLADLRIQQGRLEEAETLLAGHEDHGEALVPLARLHLAKGEPQLAKAALEQALGSGDAPTLGQAPLLLLLVEAQLASGDVASARASVDRLAGLAEHAQSDLVWAQVELTTGQVLQRTGAPGAAAHFQATLGRLRSHEQSLLTGLARFELARLHAETDRAGAITWARAARATFERIGATRDADAVAELLRHLGAPTRAAPRLAGPLTKREGEVLNLLRRGLTNREIGDRLFISAKTAEHHVSQILGKLGVRRRAEAVAYATRVSVGEGGERARRAQK